MNRHCSGYTIRCPKLVGRPYGDGFDADDQPCEFDVWITLDGEPGNCWVNEYLPACTHEWDDLTPGEQDEATEAALEASMDRAGEEADAAYDRMKDREMGL